MNRNKYFPPEFSGQIIDKKLLVAENDDLEVVVIVYAGPQFYIRNKNGDDFTGSFKFKIDQLKYLGFLPIVVRRVINFFMSLRYLNCFKTFSDFSYRMEIEIPRTT